MHYYTLCIVMCIVSIEISNNTQQEIIVIHTRRPDTGGFVNLHSHTVANVINPIQPKDNTLHGN